MGLVRSGRDVCAEGASLRSSRQQHTITGGRPVLVSFQGHLRRRRSPSSRHRRQLVFGTAGRAAGASSPTTLPLQLPAEPPRGQALAVEEPAAQPEQTASPPPDRLAIQQPTVVTPASLQLTTGLLAMGPMHRPAMQQLAMSPPSSQQPTSEVDSQLHGAVGELYASPHAQRRRSVMVLEEVLPTSEVASRDGTEGASSSTPFSPAMGDSPGAAVIQGATSPSTPVSMTSSPSPARSPPPSTSPSPVSTLQQPPPTVPPPVVQPTVRRSGRYALAADGARATDEDVMQRAMWRKAEKNLHTAGHLQMYKYSPFMVTSSESGEPRPIYEGLYTVGGYGEGYFFPAWVAA
ncbi:uncharacterized protein [Lolium perenne]|uniref:uncharacterized protein n=1 Tax=Lolium perenne TaxID=4522 RepID=UPI0021F6638D|nr:proline-rich receptor-like protein kinase PERK10 [Lolium perenne]